MKKIFLILMIQFVVLINTFGITRYVSQTGSDEYPFTTWQTAAVNIPTCIFFSEIGDTIIVGKGIYNNFVRFKKGMTLIGVNRDSCIITNYSFYQQVENYTIIMQDSCTLQNFTVNYHNYFELPEMPVCTAILVKGTGTSANYYCKIVNNIIQGFPENAQPWWYHVKYISLVYSDGIIANNQFKFFTRDTLIPGALGIMLYGSSPVITNNYFNKFNYCVYINSNTDVTSFPLIMNNYFGNSSSLFYFPIPILYDNVKYNSIYNCNYSVPLSTTNITSYPMFADTLKDYHLQKFSPLINTGDPDILNKDLSRSDIGLYGGPYGEIYNYRNLPPRIPSGLTGSIATNNKIKFNWKRNSEPDLAGYKLYYDSLFNFPVTQNRLIAAINKPDTSFLLSQPFVPKAYYKITAFDTEGNETIGSNEITIVTTAIKDSEQELPLEYSLGQNYPNPFNPETVICYSIPRKSYVSIKIFDILGKEVKTIASEEKEAGKYSISFNAVDMAGGIYFYLMQTETFNSVKKLMLIK